LIDFVAYLDKKLCHTNQKVVKLSTPAKGNHGLNNTLFVYGHNSSLEQARELFKTSKDS